MISQVVRFSDILNVSVVAGIFVSGKISLISFKLENFKFRKMNLHIRRQ